MIARIAVGVAVLIGVIIIVTAAAIADVFSGGQPTDRHD